MKIRLLTVGKPRDREAVLLHDRYGERIRSLGVEYTVEWVAETRSGSRYSDDHAMEREALALLERLGSSARGATIALDRGGRLLDSAALARELGRWAAPRATFVIGGPLGLHRRLIEAAHHCWALGPLTFPHELARVLVAEQIYRALTIRRGLPYHK